MQPQAAWRLANRLKPGVRVAHHTTFYRSKTPLSEPSSPSQDCYIYTREAWFDSQTITWTHYARKSDQYLQAASDMRKHAGWYQQPHHRHVTLTFSLSLNVGRVFYNFPYLTRKDNLCYHAWLSVNLSVCCYALINFWPNWQSLMKFVYGHWGELGQLSRYSDAYFLNCRGSIPCREKFFLFSTVPRPALGSTQSRI